MNRLREADIVVTDYRTVSCLVDLVSSLTTHQGKSFERRLSQQADRDQLATDDPSAASLSQALVVPTKARPRRQTAKETSNVKFRADPDKPILRFSPDRTASGDQRGATSFKKRKREAQSPAERPSTPQRVLGDPKNASHLPCSPLAAVRLSTRQSASSSRKSFSDAQRANSAPQLSRGRQWTSAQKGPSLLDPTAVLAPDQLKSEESLMDELTKAMGAGRFSGTPASTDTDGHVDHRSAPQKQEPSDSFRQESSPFLTLASPISSIASTHRTKPGPKKKAGRLTPFLPPTPPLSLLGQSFLRDSPYKHGSRLGNAPKKEED